jgi:hypothetical protein
VATEVSPYIVGTGIADPDCREKEKKNADSEICLWQDPKPTETGTAEPEIEHYE